MLSAQQTKLKFRQRPSSGYPAGFWRWLNANRHIYTEFEKRALAMAKTGRKRYSARTIVEVMRWETDLQDSDKQFRINDHYTPGMARYFLERWEKTYPGFFRLRDPIGLDE